MAILYTNSHGTFFDGTLMKEIQRKNNANVSSILQNVTDPCQLSDSLGNTLLHYAAEYGNNEFAQHLIDLGAVVDAPNRRHRTPLFFTVNTGHNDTVRLLVKANADMFIPDDCGQSPLARARQYNAHIIKALFDKVTVDFLKKNIEYVKSQEFHRDYGLYHFIPAKNIEIIRFLLQSGSPVNAKSQSYHNTALHLAAEHLDLENVKVLLAFNADVNAKRCDGQTPLARIQIETNLRHSEERDEADNKALEIVKVLLAAGAVLTDSVSRKLMPRKLLIYGNREMVHTLLLHGPIDLEFKDDFKETVLHILARNQHPDILEEVPDLESASKVLSDHGTTMLHAAAERGNINGIEELLKNGADVNAEDNAGKTPLSSLLDVPWFSEKEDNTLDDYLHSLEILLDHGAHPRLKPPSRGIERDKHDLLRKPVLAHIAMFEVFGQAIERSLHRTIESYDVFKKMFDLMKKQVAKMKEIMIGKSMTLLDLLIASDEKISLYARKNISITNLTKTMEENDFDSYYNRRLQTRYAKFIQLLETRKKLNILVNKIFNELYNISVYTVAEKIVNYFDDQELYTVLSIFEELHLFD